ncbi:MAG: hypothetical protein M3Q99_09015, partial [Acidobacteriota bacterium]|nr:hypothetical protein [Acidobacteriota bacterium]
CPDGILPSETVGINSSFGYTRRQDGSATAAKMAALQLFRHALKAEKDKVCHKKAQNSQKKILFNSYFCDFCAFLWLSLLFLIIPNYVNFRFSDSR